MSSQPHHPRRSSYSTSSRDLVTQLSATRTTNITSIITTHILPLLSTRASYGLSQTTIALLPSDIPQSPVPEKPNPEFSFASSSDVKGVEVIGFSSEETPEIVRLEGRMNETGFWRVQAVVEELEGRLREVLNSNSNSSLRTSRLPARSDAGSNKPKRTLLSRIMPSLGPEEGSPGGNPEVGVRSRDGVEMGMGMVLVKARLEELCLRTVTEFGLYDTMSRTCVIIRVDARY
ncbi:hypothetical protein EK21DRAFT_64613 [Setomelanomma holmii]|uniref:Uncharacterized protein n=1 Tax=Setomelanomma holmii TaxID=210430 RepID=A0A9P4LNN1_9PLEO|nr:hypothetical protein EK21DRAFT_64613 [Setomelanomma holmii]